MLSVVCLIHLTLIPIVVYLDAYGNAPIDLEGARQALMSQSALYA